MNSITFDRYQPHINLFKNQVALKTNTAISLAQSGLPYVREFGWEALDTVIAASLLTVELGMRFREGTEDPRNKERVNQIADAVVVMGGQVLDAWSAACEATIEAGYQSRPHIEKAYAQIREYTAIATLLVRFFLALRLLLTRLDWEEIEQYQTALPAAPQPVGLLAPVSTPAPATAPSDIPAPRLEDLGIRRLRAIAKERGLKTRNAEGRPWRKEELLAVLSCGR